MTKKALTLISFQLSLYKYGLENIVSTHDKLILICPNISCLHLMELISHTKYFKIEIIGSKNIRRVLFFLHE